MNTVTKKQCEAALGSISDAISEDCLVVNKDVYVKLEKAQDVINQLIEEHERLKGALARFLQDYRHCGARTCTHGATKRRSSCRMPDSRMRQNIWTQRGSCSMPTPKCKTCEYRNRNKCTRADGAILYEINWNHPGDVQIKTRPRWCPLKSE